MKIGNNILTIGTKADENISAENKGKVKYAQKYIAKLNELQDKAKYYF